jgi:hypothetical protein
MALKLKPTTWKTPPAKPARDGTGVDRGERAYGEADNPFEADRANFIGTWDRNVDAQIFGNAAVGRREGDVLDPAQPKSKRRR